MAYPDLTDTFQYDDTTDITGLTSPSGHRWVGTGANTPDIISNQLSTAAAGTGGNYAYIDLFTDPYFVWCDFKLNAGGNGVTLHSSKFNANICSTPCLTNMLHFRFTTTNCVCEVRMWANEDYHSGVTKVPEDVVNTEGRLAYGFTLSESETYRCGIKMNGDRFDVLLPGNTWQTIYSKQAASLVGRYLTFQPNAAKIDQVFCSVKKRGRV